MRKCVYEDNVLMDKISSLKRYINEGAGTYSGTKQQFTEFLKTVNERIGTLELNIDGYSVMDPGEYVNFLDIQYTFDDDGSLQTDLYVKPTDSRSYLQYGSAHPSHVFSAVIYSQCLRLRRIINCNGRLQKRLEELKCGFLNSDYPEKMVTKIVSKLSSMERILKGTHKKSNSQEIVSPTTPEQTVRIVSTFGSDSSLLEITQKF